MFSFFQETQMLLVEFTPFIRDEFNAGNSLVSEKLVDEATNILRERMFLAVDAFDLKKAVLKKAVNRTFQEKMEQFILDKAEKEAEERENAAKG